MDHSSLLPLLICLDSHHPPFISLIVQSQYTGITVSELLTHPPWSIILTTRVQCLYIVSFPFIFTDSTYFQGSLGQYLSPICFREVVSQICNTADGFITFCIMSWDFLDLLNDFCNLHTLRFTLCAA